jgi:hypothetical protein
MQAMMAARNQANARPPGMAKGGSIDGCAKRGKTKAKRY